MARRRRLIAPSPEALTEIARIAAPPPPIARVAGAAAGAAADALAEARADAAAAQRDAALWRDADEAGRAARALPLDAVRADHLTRDRAALAVEPSDGAPSALDDEAMRELVASIRAHGVRAPIEVLRLEGETYGLISGWRRLHAMRALHRETGEARFAAIPAFIRAPDGAAGAYAAMVEENEIRADLSQYERGRIAAIAAADGVFPDLDAAVNTLFAAGSKAKRSKIRSFARVHAALGDALRFGPALPERALLRLAGAIRDGGEQALLAALAEAADSPEAEWAALEGALRGAAPESPAPASVEHRDLGHGVAAHLRRKGAGVSVLIDGEGLDPARAEAVLSAVRAALAGEG